MSDTGPVESEFVMQVNATIAENIANEQFGVTELAEKMNMSRSNLLRKVKKDAGLSVSQLISQVRLNRAMELLQKTSLNVSEVSHHVGFGSTSYFIKCFREYYGYPPGEVGKKDLTEPAPVFTQPPGGNRKLLLRGGMALLIILAAGLLIYFAWPVPGNEQVEKSIAVLPFKNDSGDSTNIYLINGLMESTLNNLQRIKDLKVISRTSSEKYRNSTRSIPEMAKELNVTYFVEGSGQKIGDQILLNIQLIEGSSDRHLWSRQYRREAKDIFTLQQEIARNIAEAIQVIVTPDEATRIGKNPTDDLVAYDYFLKGADLFAKGGTEGLEEAVQFFKKAIEQDNEFALAYAETALVYYYLDMFQTQKKYSLEINSNADRALLLDPKSPNSLAAKAVFYIHKKDYESALPYLEKALEYNPNSALVINFLSELYNRYIPNTAKYIEYALKGARLDITAHDSSSTSYNYLHLSNALIQTGFVDEALKYIDKSLAFNPKNPFSGMVRVFILYAKNKDLKLTRELLEKELSKDTTFLYMVEELGKVCYLQRDYEGAYQYYKHLIALRETKNLELFKNEALKIAFVLSKLGQMEKSERYVKSFKEFADSDKSIYRHLHLAAYYVYRNDHQKALEHMKLFSKEQNFQYWILLMEDDPMVDQIKTHPEFKQIMSDIKTRFWDNHKKIREKLTEEELI